MLPRRASRWLVLLSVALSALGVRSAAAGDGDDRPKPGRPEDGKGGKGDKADKGDKAEKPEKAEAAKPWAVGDTVKDLSLDLAEGGSWSPTAGRPAVLVFGGAWSAESVEALKRLADPKGRLAAVRADLLGVLRDATAEKAREVAKAEKLTARLAVDPKRKAYDRFATRGLPYTVVLDGAGKIVLSESGFDDGAVASKLEEAGRPADRR